MSSHLHRSEVYHSAEWLVSMLFMLAIHKYPFNMNGIFILVFIDYEGGMAEYYGVVEKKAGMYDTTSPVCWQPNAR